LPQNVLLDDLDQERKEVQTHEVPETLGFPYYGTPLPPNPADIEYCGATIHEILVDEEFYSSYCRRGNVYFPTGNDPVRYCPADISHDPVVPEDAENRRFIMISSSGTTNTLPAIFEDPNQPNHFFFTGHHHEAIAIRKAPPQRPNPKKPGSLKVQKNRRLFEDHDPQDRSGHTYNLRSPFQYQERPDRAYYPGRPLGGSGAGVSYPVIWSSV
jgi:hypothetical protein